MKKRTANIETSEKKQHFSIRKLTIGAASVLVGTTVWLGNNSKTVQADTNDNSGEATDTLITNSDNQSSNQAERSSENVEKKATTQVGNEKQEDAVAKTEEKQVQTQDQQLNSQAETSTSTTQEQTDKKVVEQAQGTTDQISQKDTENKVADANKQLENKSTQPANETETTDKQKVNAPVVTNKEVKTSTNDADKQTYNVTVTLKNIAREDGKLNLNPNWPVNRGWVYNFKDQVLTLNDVKDGTRVYSLGLAPTGFKLMNPEVLEQNFKMDGNVALVNGKDANVTLEYAPISPILVKYVDEDTGEVLSSSSVGANTSTTASLENFEGDPTAIGLSKFLVKAIDIPGYEAVGDTEIIDTYNNVQSLGDLNYQVVTFKYKKVMDNENPKKDNAGSGAQYGDYFGPSWNTIDPADIFNVSGVKGQTYEKDNGDMEAKYQYLIDKYQNQGHTFMGIFNYHKNTDFYNWNEGGTSINLIPNKDVTVRYVDEQGNELSAEDILSDNPNNPDQTNNGVNPAKHWYSAGKWHATAKNIDGYTLKTTYGATSGNYTPYKYVVTFEYAKDAAAKVIYIDDDATDQAKSTLKTDDLNGYVGDKIDYSTMSSIDDFEKQGYVLVSDNFPADPVYKDSLTDNTFEVHLKHGVIPVTPDTPDTEVPKTPEGTTVVNPTDLTKKVNLTVNYVNSDGNEFTGEIPADAKQTATFTGIAYVDAVTGQLVNAKQKDGKWVIDTDNTATPQITWTSDKTSFNGVISPTEKGYHVTNVSSHADGDNVAAINGLTKDTGDIAITVTYAANGTDTINNKTIDSKQVINYVDENGNKLADSNTQTSQFIYSGDIEDSVTHEILNTGSWNTNQITYENVKVPVIDGYVAVSGFTRTSDGVITQGQTATRENPDIELTVVYKKVGKIVPVGPDGKTPIPDAPTPSYPNDPTDPTKVTPDEPVPTIPGYKPEVPTVTPSIPTEDTPVIYNQIQKADLVIIDQDNNNAQIVIDGITTKFTDDGIKDEDIVFTGTEASVKALQDKGYEYVSSDFTDGTKFDGDADSDQHFVIIMKHGTVPVTPDKPGHPGEPINPENPDVKWPDGTSETDLKKTGTQTIHYVYADGTKAKDDNVQSFDFTRTAVVDKVTGKIISTTPWNVDSHTFGSVDTPVINYYHADKRTAGGETVNPDDLAKEVTVTYTPNGHIIPVDPDGKPIPNVPTPQYPTDPTDPTKVTPNEPVPEIPGMTPSTPTVTPTDPGKDTPVPYTPNPSQPTTPQQPTTPDTNVVPKPETPNPEQPTNPTTPETPTSPETVTPHAQTPDSDEPNDDVPAPTPHATVNKSTKTATPVDNLAHNETATVNGVTNKQVNTSASQNTEENTLPQTGSKDTTGAKVLGSLAAGLGLIGLAGAKKRRKN